MPGGFPFLGEICNGSQSIVNPATNARPQVLTYPGSTNTKAAYLTLIASTASDTCFALIQLHCGSGSGIVNGLVDIAVGAAASEVVVCSNLYVSLQNSAGGAAYTSYPVPLNIPAGTRVAARCQVDNISGSFQSVSVGMILFDGGFSQTESCGGVDVLGVSTSTSLGTSLAVAAGTTTMGSYSQLIASTARDYVGVIPIAAGFTANDDFLIDLAIGAGAAEQVIIPNMCASAGSGIHGNGVTGYYVPVNIPAGSRVAARASSQFGGGVSISLAVAGVYQ